MIASTVPRVRHPLALRLQCRKEWVEGQGTLAEIAGKHNVPPQTLTAWYRREKWSPARNRWREKQLSDNEAPAKPPSNAPDAGNSRDARVCEYDLHLQRLRHQLEAEQDAVKIDRLCAAIAKLEDVFCRYAGIPLPGSRRPGRERDDRRQPVMGCYGPAPTPTATPAQPPTPPAKPPG